MLSVTDCTEPDDECHSRRRVFEDIRGNETCMARVCMWRQDITGISFAVDCGRDNNRNKTRLTNPIPITKVWLCIQELYIHPRQFAYTSTIDCIDIKMTINSSDGVALYAQVREAIREQITRGELKPGERLMPEEELVTLFGTSRMTVRRGILDLIDEGVLYRRRGVGTFVAHRHLERDHNRLVGYLDTAVTEGFVPGIEILAREITGAKLLVARALGLHENEPVIRVRTLRLADGESLGVHDEHVPYKLYPDLLDANIENRQLWEVLSEHGFPIKRAVQRVEARLAEEEIAELLGIEEGSPILYKLRTVYSEDGTPLEFAICHNRGDRYSSTNTLTR